MSDHDREDDHARPGAGDDRSGTGDRREPLGDLTEKIERRRRQRDGEAFEDAFEDVPVESVDPDAVWEELSRDDVEPSAEPDFETGEAVDPDLDRDVRVVDKRSFCQGCRHFADPPAVACTHEGTAILELVDADHFRVADCPMVAEAEELTDELESDESPDL